MEREPQDRYSTANEFAWDLEHLDQVAVSDRAELRDWKRRRTPWLKQVLFYIGMALIPVLIEDLTRRTCGLRQSHAGKPQEKKNCQRLRERSETVP